MLNQIAPPRTFARSIEATVAEKVRKGKRASSRDRKSIIESLRDLEAAARKGRTGTSYRSFNRADICWVTPRAWVSTTEPLADIERSNRYALPHEAVPARAGAAIFMPLHRSTRTARLVKLMRSLCGGF